MITTNSNNKFTIVTIEKYNDYQADKRKIKQQNNSKVTTKEQQNNTNNNVNNLNNLKNIYSDFSDELKIALDDFVKMREKIRAPLTDKAMKLAISKLKQLSSQEETQIQIINESVLNNWKSFYPLKENQKSETNLSKKNSYNNYEQRKYDDLEKLLANGGNQ